MMNRIKKYSHLLFLLLCFLTFNISVKASGSATLSFSGSSSVYAGKNVEVTLMVSNLKDVDGGIQSIGAKLAYDANCLEFVSNSNMASAFSVTYVNSSKKIAGLGMGTYITGNSNLIKFVFKTKSVCTGTVKLEAAELSDSKGENVSTNNPSKTISVTPPPSTNANLSNISLSSGSISFNKNTTSYNINVDGSVTSINVSASTEDSGAKVTGTGTKSLSYGNNTIKLVVTAPSGDKKTYTINVNRKDTRSTVNTLKSLSVSGNKIGPNFNASTTTYSLTVPFTTSSVNVSATATDDKATVKINGGSSLAAGRTTNISIVVTAENGSSKTYTIKVRREQDPNKVKSTNNNLASLTVSTGTLSSAFNKDTTEYTVTVPTEVEEFKITATPADKEYGEVDITGPDKLKIGENKYQIKVTAEDGSTKTYTVVVTREGDPEEVETEEQLVEEPVEIKTLDLKSINITNGKLKEDFDKNVHIYHYKKDRDFKFEANAEDEENTITIYENEGIYTIVVENLDGETSIYTLLPEESNTILIVVIIISIVLICVGFVLGYLIGSKKITFPKNKNVKTKVKKNKKLKS